MRREEGWRPDDWRRGNVSVFVLSRRKARPNTFPTERMSVSVSRLEAGRPSCDSMWLVGASRSLGTRSHVLSEGRRGGCRPRSGLQTGMWRRPAPPSRGCRFAAPKRPDQPCCDESKQLEFFLFYVSSMRERETPLRQQQRKWGCDSEAHKTDCCAPVLRGEAKNKRPPKEEKKEESQM